jgi:hypothetical protein
MRAPSVAGLLRVAGLAGTLTGCVLAVAALSAKWAVDGPGEGHAPEQNGWHYLDAGAALLTAGCALVVILAVALAVGPRSRRVSRTAGSGAVALLLAAVAGVALLWWLNSLDVSFFTDDDQAVRYDPGPGFQHAIIGLLVAVVGTWVLLAGRWEARPRSRSRRRGAPPPGSGEPSWLAPG